MDSVCVGADEQIQAEAQQSDVNVVCGPKPLAVALKYLRRGCVGGWSAQNVTTMLLGFLPTLQQRALRKREKLNAQGQIWLPIVMPALRALDVELQSHAELSTLVSPFLSKILQGERGDLGNFLCIFIGALQKVPFSVQRKVMLPAMESMLANHSDFVVNLLDNEATSMSPSANALATTWTALTANNLKTGMKVHFKCMGIANSKATNLRVNLRVGQDGRADGYGSFGPRATWTVNVVGEHDGFPVVTLCADVNNHSCYLHMSEDGTVDTVDACGADCEFLVLSQEGHCVALQSHSKSSLRVRIAEDGAEFSDAQSLFTVWPEQRTLKSTAWKVAKQSWKLYEGYQKVQNPGDDDVTGIACSDLKDGLQVHFRCVSMHDKKARNLRVGEGGGLEGFGGCGARATWSVGLVGEHQGAPVATLCVHIKGQVSYLRVAEDEKTIDGQGTGDSRCHFIVRAHDHSCVELQWLANPSVRVRIDPSGQTLDATAGSEDAQTALFIIVPAARSGKIAPKLVVAKEVCGKIKQAIGGNAQSTRLKLSPEDIQNGMKLHMCCLGRTGIENRNLRVRSDGDVEGRGGFGARATWTVDGLSQHEGLVVCALRACIDGQSWYLRAANSGTKIDGRGTGGSDCMFVVRASRQDGALELHSFTWPAAKVMVGPCGKLLDPLGEGTPDQQALKLLGACSSPLEAAGPRDAAPSTNITESTAPIGESHNSMTLNANELEEGLRVRFKCMSMPHKKASNLRVGQDGCLEGHGGYGARATWTVSRVGEIEGAPIVALSVHIKGQVSYLHVAEDGKTIDVCGKKDANCHFIVTKQGESCVGLQWLARSSVRVRIGPSGEALDPCAEDPGESGQFTILTAVPQDLAHQYMCARSSIRQAQVQTRLLAQSADAFLGQGVSPKDLLKAIRTKTRMPLLKVPGTSFSTQKKLEVLTVHGICDGLRVHLQCNGRRGAQRQNLRLCSSGDVEGLGMFGNPATWTLHTVGEHNGCPIVTLHVELQGLPHYLRLDEQGQKIDGRGQGGVECHFMVKTLHLDSNVSLHPVVSPLARLGVGADGAVLGPFAAESDLQFSFSVLLSRHNDTPDWQVVDEATIRQGNGDEPTKVMAEPPQEWSVLDSKEGQSGDDW